MALRPFKKTPAQDQKAQHHDVAPVGAGRFPLPVCSSETGWFEPRVAGDPRHIAVIMDGNGRWAKKRLLPRKIGHREGAEALRRMVDCCIARGIPYLTLFAFSSENWQRPQSEINDLMDLLRRFVNEDIRELEERGVKGCFIGDRSALDEDIRARMEQAEARTKENRQITVTVAFSYGAQQELADAMAHIARQVARGELNAEQITPELISKNLYTNFLPDPDLVIRTSGERRLSNFLLWQAAYAELAFPEFLWPDFDEGIFENLIEDYRGRDRRFGARPDETEGGAHG